jgi:pentatricopeptide repeat protein
LHTATTPSDSVTTTPTPTTTLSIVSWNIYLAALCDDVQNHESLQMACDWLLEYSGMTTHDQTNNTHNITTNNARPQPDITSFNTVLHAAAKARNVTMVETVLWKRLVLLADTNKHANNNHHNNYNSSSSSNRIVPVRPDIRSYNARLLATSSYARRIEIWKEIVGKANHNHFLYSNGIQPDRYTLDLMLLPLLQQQPKELRSLLKTFVQQRQNDHVLLRDVLAAFMITLVQVGKVSEARQFIFDPYLLPCLSSHDNNTNNKQSSIVLDDRVECRTRIQTRHFNILIDGYRQEAARAAKLASSKIVALTLIPTSVVNFRTIIGQNNEQHQQEQEESKESLMSQVQELTKLQQDYRSEGRRLFEIMMMMNRRFTDADVKPDSYTLSSVMGLVNTPQEIVDILTNTTSDNNNNNIQKFVLSPVVIRSAITAAGRLGDATLVCALFDTYHPAVGGQPKNTDPRLWNVVLGALEDCAEQDNGVVDTLSNATLSFQAWRRRKEGSGTSSDNVLQSTLSTMHLGKTSTQAVQDILCYMESCGVTPNWQTYCSAAAALQYASNAGPDLAMSLFRNATTKQGISPGADGRFINAIFRCFGDDIDQAISYWKSDLRSACVAYESRPRPPLSTSRATNKNLIAAYNGLMHVCGRADRPDIGVRLAYAMNREGIEPNDITLNNYRAGKRIRKRRNRQERAASGEEKLKLGSLSLLSSLSKLGTTKQYESLLYVECTKYNQYSKRTASDQRVRIIV